LIKNLKDIYPFSIIQPSNYLKNSAELFSAYRLLADTQSGILFDRFFISRASIIEDQEDIMFLYSDLISDNNRLVLLECDYDKILQRLDEKKKLKFSYKAYETKDIQKIATKMRNMYDIIEKNHKGFCFVMDTSNQSKEESLEQVLNFMKR
jgi:thymidylate kinase